MTRKRSKTVVRTCVGCGRQDAQDAMVRFRAGPGGALVIANGKPLGRSAYLHPTQACRSALVRSKRLQRSLRETVSAESRRGFAAGLAVKHEGPRESTAPSVPGSAW